MRPPPSFDPLLAPPSLGAGLVPPPPPLHDPLELDPLEPPRDPTPPDPECDPEPPELPPDVPRVETPPSLRVDAPRPASADCGSAISSANAPAATASPLLPLIANLKLSMTFHLLLGHPAHPFPAAP